MKTATDTSVCFKCTVIDDQHPNGVPLEQWGNQSPIQEPVALAKFDGTLHWIEPYGIGLNRIDGPLYTTPPAQRQWVGLTVEDIIDVIHPPVMADMPDEVTDYEICRAIEAKLKEKNT